MCVDWSREHPRVPPTAALDKNPSDTHQRAAGSEARAGGQTDPSPTDLPHTRFWAVGVWGGGPSRFRPQRGEATQIGVVTFLTAFFLKWRSRCKGEARASSPLHAEWLPTYCFILHWEFRHEPCALGPASAPGFRSPPFSTFSRNTSCGVPTLSHSPIDSTLLPLAVLPQRYKSTGVVSQCQQVARASPHLHMLCTFPFPPMHAGK